MSPATAREKILCIVFKYLGDVVVSIPALRALRQAKPEAEIHLLVAEDAVPLVRTLPWIDRTWSFPRTRGQARLRDSLPVIRALRREHFDLSLDFIGNDRGAFLSLSISAKRRVGLDAPRGFFGRRWCYHQRISEPTLEWHETRRHLHFVEPFGADPQANLELELHADPAYAARAEEILPGSALIAHITTSKPLKEWPLPYWKELAQKASSEGFRIVFASGPSARERAQLEALRASLPGSQALPQIQDLGLYLAILARARMLISGDTGPMHFAAGLGVPTVSMFGPSFVHQWAPTGKRARALIAPNCRCSHNELTCIQAIPCWQGLTPDRVLNEVRSVLQNTDTSSQNA